MLQAISIERQPRLMVKETRFPLLTTYWNYFLFHSMKYWDKQVGRGESVFLNFHFSPGIIDYIIDNRWWGEKEKKKRKKWKGDYWKDEFSFASWNILSHLDVEWVPRREPCLPRKSLVSQSNRTQNHGAESRLTARRRENTLCYRRKGLFENVWRKLEEETVSRVGSSNFSTSHWNTENVSFSLFCFTLFSRAEWFHLSLFLSLSLLLFFFVFFPLLPPLFRTLKIYFYIYFNSVIEDIKHTPLAFVIEATHNRSLPERFFFSDPISFLSRFFPW